MSAQGKNGEFYAKGKDVWKSPTVTRNTDNTGDSIEVGFKVCTVSEWLDAETIVGVFTEHAALQERVRRLEEENARLWDVLKLSDAETRQWFIGDLIRKNGKLNRSEICEAFKISVAQASADIQKWLAANPGKASYNVHTKRYEGSADGQA